MPTPTPEWPFETWSSILLFLDFYDLHRLASSNRYLQSLVADYIQFRVQLAVERYIQHYSELLNLLRDTDSVVSGPFLSDVLSRLDSLPPCTLEILCPRSRESFQQITSHLHVREGYITQNIAEHDDGVLDGVFADNTGSAVGFSRRVQKKAVMKHPGRDLYIIVVQSIGRSALDALTDRPTTLELNYLSPTTLVCAYPSFTFRREAVIAPLSVRNLRNQVQAHWHRYLLRGYDLISFASNVYSPNRRQAKRDDGECNAQCPFRRRTFEDSGSWKFPMADLQKELPAYPGPKWRMGGSYCPFGCNAGASSHPPPT